MKARPYLLTGTQRYAVKAGSNSFVNGRFLSVMVEFASHATTRKMQESLTIVVHKDV